MTPRCTADLATHCWRLRQAVTLSVPDTLGRIEAHVIWECCWCHQQGDAWGVLPLNQPIPDPATWDARTAAQRANGADPYALVWARLEGAQRLALRLAKGALLALLLLLPAVSQARCPPEHRSAGVARAFRQWQPCPATGLRTGRCDGWVIDHTVPLCAGGPDQIRNMTWMTRAAAAAKDRQERAQCRALWGHAAPGGH